MIKSISIAVFILLVSSLFFTESSIAISPLNDKEMKKHTGQSGISVALKDVTIYHHDTSIKLSDKNSGSEDYIEFQNISRLHILNTGDSDLNSDGTIGSLKIDMVSRHSSDQGYSSPYLSIRCDDWGSRSFLYYEKMLFSDIDLGSIKIDEFMIPQWNLNIGGHSSGIDFEMGLQAHVQSFRYDYGPPTQNNFFQLQGIHLANDFTSGPNNDPSDPSTWNSSGKFRIGDLSNNSPATIDVGIRAFDNTPIIKISAPMSGSFRIENIHLGNQNFGPAAMDGINVHRMTIEIPGRSLGNS